MHPLQHRSSQRSGRRRFDGKAVGLRSSVPPEDAGRLAGRAGVHGAEEVAGTGSSEQEGLQPQQRRVSVLITQPSD